MKHEIPFRIKITNPLAGVLMKVQRGKNELLEPIRSAATRLEFEFDITVDLSGGTPNFLGKFAQGPKDARFVYVNSGTCAGQIGTLWTRRAKLSLMSISKKQIETVIGTLGLRFETTIEGVARDGGPVCASVKGVEWKVVK